MQNTIVLVQDWGKSSVWTRGAKGGRTTSDANQAKLEGSSVANLSFEIGDFVYLKVSPMKGVRRFNVKGKLAPRYIGPFKVERRGEVVYRLELPEKLAGVHNVFHVSQLKKCLRVQRNRFR